MFGSVSGLTKYLSDVEEEELVQFLLGCSSIGFAKSRKQILAIIQSVVHQKGINVTVTNGWWDSLEKSIHHYLLEILNNFPMLELCVPHLKHLIIILIFLKKH